MNEQCTVSGNFTTIAPMNAKQRKPNNSHAVQRTIQGGGSCGSISDSLSIDPRCVIELLMSIFAKFPVVDSRGNSRARVAPSIHRDCQLRRRCPFPIPRLRALPE